VKEIPLEGDLLGKILAALQRSALFQGLGEPLLRQIAGVCRLMRCDEGEVVVTQGEASDAFYLILSGACRVIARNSSDDEPVELGRLAQFDGLGEMGLLLNQPRTATVIAAERSLLLRLDATVFKGLYEIPEVGLAISRALAERLQRASRNLAGPSHDLQSSPPTPEVAGLLPMEFVQRHRVLPVKSQGGRLSVGFVDEPTPRLLNLVREAIPGMEIRAVRITKEGFDQVLRSTAGIDGWTAPAPATAAAPAAVEERRTAPRLDPLLKRMVAEGASDLHLCGGQQPRWRIDGDMLAIAGMPPLAAEETFELLKPVMDQKAIDEFVETNDADFAYAIPGTARFRVNLFADNGGTGAVLRVIPSKILQFDQLGLSEAVRNFCSHPKGLVLVTGPTGSGKSTTMAAMIDHINRTQPAHIITLEDPIEFVHESRSSLVNQREVGRHTQSFLRALRAALREDPDIVLVGEMRDLETISLALEIANTGHLVFGTLHTTTAIGTIERIVEIFPVEEQNRVRAGLADTLRGVVAQTLCKRIGGGRVGVYEVLVPTSAVANLIREGKSHQIMNLMQTGKALGNSVLNEEMARHVQAGRIAYEEALAKTPDKKDLARRLGRELPGNVV
jgi:twitching motility protein PilT